VNGIQKKVLHHIDLFSIVLLFRDLASGAKPRVLPHVWVFNAFLGFTFEELVFLAFNCVAVI